MLTCVIVGAGCAPSVQTPAPTRATAGAVSSATPTSTLSAVASSSPRPPELDWSRTVAPIEYNPLPQTSRGQWTVRAPLAKDQELLLLVPSDAATDEQRATFVSELARFDLKTGATTTLVRLQPNTTAAYAIVAGSEFVWIETSPADLRAYDWRLHRTNWRTGVDAVVASDPGLRPDQNTSLLPAVAFDGVSLLFTTLARARTELVWDLRRLRDGQETTLVQIADPARQRVLHITSRESTTAWVEQSVAQGFPVTSLGISDGTTVRRITPQLNAVYRLALSSTTLFLATDRGVLHAPLPDPHAPEQLSIETSNTDQLELAGRYLVYNNFDAAQSVAAIDTGTGAHSVLGRSVSYGPITGNGTILWFERAAAGTPARVARTTP